MWNEFKDFAFKGNAFDLAIGVIMGGAFGKIVGSLVDDLIMPVIGLLTGGISFSQHFLSLSSAVKSTNYADAAKEGAVFGYGNFVQVLIGFLILAAVLFVLVKFSNSLKKKTPPAAPAGPTPSEALLAEIRDALKKR
jgi:large conductance mechanosensitive channel